MDAEGVGRIGSSQELGDGIAESHGTGRHSLKEEQESAMQADRLITFVSTGEMLGRRSVKTIRRLIADGVLPSLHRPSRGKMSSELFLVSIAENSDFIRKTESETWRCRRRTDRSQSTAFTKLGWMNSANTKD